jgi:predicted flap endonuclease-1-like 5' DNA nuclease
VVAAAEEIDGMNWWLDNVQAMATRERAEKALTLPLGMTSPLWLAFGAAASAGVAWWWATRWTQAVNLEAMSVAPAPAVEPIAVESEIVAVIAEPEVEPVIEAAPAIEAADVGEAEPEPEPEPAAEPDDLTRLVGIGPKLAEALAGRGVTRFAQLAEWTDEDLSEVDAALKLKGRAVRDAWVAQARRMTTGG